MITVPEHLHNIGSSPTPVPPSRLHSPGLQAEQDENVLPKQILESIEAPPDAEGEIIDLEFPTEPTTPKSPTTAATSPAPLRHASARSSETYPDVMTTPGSLRRRLQNDRDHNGEETRGSENSPRPKRRRLSINDGTAIIIHGDSSDDVSSDDDVDLGTAEVFNDSDDTADVLDGNDYDENDYDEL